MLFWYYACEKKVNSGKVKEKMKEKISRVIKILKKKWQLYLFLVPAVIFTALFHYKPMYGILIAFKDYSFRKGIWGSTWVGLKNFERVFSSYWFPISLKNTLTISLMNLLIGFPAAIVLALLFNEVKSARYRKTVQTISYAPYFISTVVICGMISIFLNSSTGIVNTLLGFLGHEPVAFLESPKMFKWVYTLTGIWQGIGWSSIIYFAALAGVDKSLLEAAEIDGAGRFQRILHVSIPVIIPTIVTTFILQCGSVLSVGYEKAYLLQNDLNLVGSEIISTYTYKIGLEQTDFSYSAAIGIFNSVVNCIVLIIANRLSKKATDEGLF